MISLEEAQARVLSMRGPVECETVPLQTANGRWLSADMIANRTQPARDLSAMDGYAIRYADLPGPWQVTGESAAGRAFAGSIGAGQAVRIFTGAAMPDGADSVIIQEEVSADAGTITKSGEGPPKSGAHVRIEGSDFRAGQVLATKGQRLTPARIALAALSGHANLPVHSPVRVAIISTGNELVGAGDDIGNDQIPASNGPMLAAILGDLPCVVKDLGIVRDDMAALVAAFASATVEADIIVTTGGASVGDHDLVRPALLAAGATIDFWKVAMRPGKPLMSGMLGETAVLGLPGNPVSAFVTAILFLKPLVAALAGAADPLPQRLNATLGGALPAVPGRTDHVRALISTGIVSPLGTNDSAALLALSHSNALIVRTAGSPPAEVGETVEIIPLLT